MNKRPNVFLFLPDALQAEVVKPDHVCKTPHIERVARRGITLNRAYTVLPVCSPARASLMTGLLPHNHGVLHVEHCVDDDQSVLRRQHSHWATRRGLVASVFPSQMRQWLRAATHSNSMTSPRSPSLRT